MLRSSQLRAARALLGWRQEDLAEAADVGLATIARIEQGAGVVQGNFSTIMKLQSTLELHGIRFMNDADGYGVRVEFSPGAAAKVRSGSKRGNLGESRRGKPTRRNTRR